MHKGLIEHFEALTDPRLERTKRYPLKEIILLSIAGTVSGYDGWKSLKNFGEAKLDRLRKFLPKRMEFLLMIRWHDLCVKLRQRNFKPVL